MVQRPVKVPEDAQVAIVQVESTRYAMAFISGGLVRASGREDEDHRDYRTKGKTTPAYLVKSILENTGLKVGLIGTIEAIIGDKHYPLLRIPRRSPIFCRAIWRRWIEAGCDAVVMEVSSQALMQHRSQGFVI